MEGALRSDEKKVTPDFTADFAVTGLVNCFPRVPSLSYTRALAEGFALGIATSDSACWP